VNTEPKWRAAVEQLRGALKRHWINDEYCDIKLRLPHAKEPLRKVTAIKGTRHQKNIHQL